MSLRVFDFECDACGMVFEDLVEGSDGKSDPCPNCSSVFTKKLPSAVACPTAIVVSYPGSKKLKAGYVHTHGNRPAEKKGRQISMHGAYKK